MEKNLVQLDIEDIPDELWDKLILMKKQLAPELSMDEWLTWLLRQGLKLYDESKRKIF